jgi:predicted O-methyltransferase YrrM
MNDKSKLLNNYIITHSVQEDPILAKLSRETHLKVLNPRMICGPLQGKFLEFISRMIHPEYILEIGTYTGYSAICLARGLRETGKLITIEKNDELIQYPLKYFKESGLDSKIELITGNALRIIPTLPYNFDLIYIDGNKKEYIKYFEAVIEKLSPEGFIIIDNVLWNGKVLKKAEITDQDTQIIQEFNDLIYNDLRVENIILPIRDGICLMRKI